MFRQQAWVFIILIGCFTGCLISESFYQNRGNNFAEEISQNLKSKLTELRNEATKIKTEKALTWSTLAGAHYLIYNGELKAWSVTDFAPDTRMITDTSALQFRQTALGDFIIIRKSLNTNEELISMLPLVRRYPIANRYLPAQLNEAVFKQYQVRVFPPESPTGESISFNHQSMFRVSLQANAGTQVLTLILELAF